LVYDRNRGEKRRGEEEGKGGLRWKDGVFLEHNVIARRMVYFGRHGQMTRAFRKG
jgi:hypothetical protein